ncbi:TraR/DksA C4-type zinc finger protein [Desulfobulbus propionicus]
MDEIDAAQKAERLFREGALASMRRPKAATREGLTHCVDCGEEIPEKRRLAVPNCCRCLECQEEHERGDTWR